MCVVCKTSANLLNRHGYVQCTSCQTYIANRLPPQRIVQHVLEEHAQAYILAGQQAVDYATYKHRRDLLSNYLKSVQTILDFGCGNGNFVTFLRSNKYKAFGYDKSASISTYLRAYHIPSYKSLSQIPTKQFDIVTCFDVIEHTTKPIEVIRIIRNKLKKDGILMISTPNACGISARLLGQKWWVFGPTAHFMVFSPYSLQLLLKRMGFRILDTRTDTLTQWVMPSEQFLPKVLNKCIYIALFPFRSLLFQHYLGDNIQVIAKKI